MNRYDGPITDHRRDAIFLNAGSWLCTRLYERPNFFIRGFWNRWDDYRWPEHVSAAERFPSLYRSKPQSILNFRGDTYNVEAQHSVELLTDQSADLRTSTIVSIRSRATCSTITTIRKIVWGFMCRMNGKRLDCFSVVAGVRYDLDTFIHPTLSPRITLLYRPVQIIPLLLGYRKPIVPPTLVEVLLQFLGFVTLPPPLPSPPPICGQRVYQSRS